jgi:S-adenosylmethionine:tRNA ribosyltransferase-isomerase
MPPDVDLRKIMRSYGVTPLPPYIKRSAKHRAPGAEKDGLGARTPRGYPVLDADGEQYQTVYAREEGAVAAPTAGLHFTAQLLDRIRALGILVHSLTLHIGPGSFQPVQADEVSSHRMEPERYAIPEDTACAINAARAEGRRVVAVGTTSVRAMEHAVDEDGIVRARAGETDLLITPGHRFRTVDVLLTNFHLPKSTLLMLVSAFAGVEVIRRAYAEAITQRYRFYSYGDAMLII